MAMPLCKATLPRQSSAELLRELRVAALGGGTGLPSLLRGLCPMLYGGVAGGEEDTRSDQLVAIVTTTDDGGSSGRLRREFGMIPPGDVRNCLAAMAEDQSHITAAFQFRFEAGDGLDGHALGNLMLTALTEITGDFTRAVEIAGRVVGARGRVIPASTGPLVLSAELVDGRVVDGETSIVGAGAAIRRLSLAPSTAKGVDAALDALRRADVIIAGPGSLYTSLLPPLLIPEIVEAIRLADAIRIFVMNLMTEPGETDGMDAARHLDVIRDHLGFQPFQHVIFNTSAISAELAARYAVRGAYPIVVTPRDFVEFERVGVRPLGVPLVSEDSTGKIRHHGGRLAAAVAACARLERRSPASS